MNNSSLSFRVAVNSDRATIIRKIKELFGDISDVSEDTSRFELKGNYVTISLNDDFNASLALDSEDGFLYYENNIDFFSSEGNTDLLKQIAFAKNIAYAFENDSIKCEIISEFEHML